VGYYNPVQKTFGIFPVDMRLIKPIGQLVSGAALLEAKHRLELQQAFYGLRPVTIEPAAENIDETPQQQQQQ
jgi:hypothetical protein